MADTDSPLSLPPPNPEHRKVAAGQFERANQVIATGNFDYGIQLLLTCCQLDPANLIYRKALRKTEKAKYKNNLKGSRLGFLQISAIRTKLKGAKRGRDYLKVLEFGEKILVHNPWDIGAQMDMAEAADTLNMVDVAVWILEQARQKDQMDATVNRALARLYEKRGNFRQAMHLWELVRKKDPTDVEAQHKAKDLAVCETIQRGQYGQALGLAPAEEVAEGEIPPERSGPVLRPEREILAGKAVGATTSTRINREAAQLRLRIDSDPTNASLYLQLAAYFRRYEQFEQARDVLHHGLGPTGNNFEMQMELAELEIEPFRRNLAITEEKLKSQPNDEELRKIRVRLLKEINTRELDGFRRKAERSPTELGYRFEVGVRLLRAGQVDEAIKELQAARGDPRHHSRALLYLGYCFKSRNNWRLAQRNFEEVLQTLPTGEDAMRKEALFQLASGCAEAGELARAVELAYELANLDFTYKDIGRLLDDWQGKLQQQQANVSG